MSRDEYIFNCSVGSKYIHSVYCKVCIGCIQVDLRKLGISDYGELASGMLGDCANNKLELFAEDMVYTLNDLIDAYSLLYVSVHHKLMYSGNFLHVLIS